MPHTRLQINGFEAIVPESFLDQEDVEDAIEALLLSAFPHYNVAVRAVNERRIEDALREARTASRLAPYSTRILEFEIALTLQHGDLNRTHQLLQWSEEIGLDWDEDYQTGLISAVDQWNRYVSQPELLRRKYQEKSANSSYREVLLLVAHLENVDAPDVTGAEQTHIAAYGAQLPEDLRPSSRDASVPTERSSVVGSQLLRRPFALLGLAIVVGLLVGIGGTILADRTTPDTESPPTTTVPPGGSSGSELEQHFVQVTEINQHLVAGEPLQAQVTLQNFTTQSDSVPGLARDTYNSLRQIVIQHLYRASNDAWNDGNFARVVETTKPILDDEVGDLQRKLYYLGISAWRIGDRDLATSSLLRLFQEGHLDQRHPHFEAQAAYVLVRLLPNDKAQRFARVIADKYRDTLYFNSVVRSHLQS